MTFSSRVKDNPKFLTRLVLTHISILYHKSLIFLTFMCYIILVILYSVDN